MVRSAGLLFIAGALYGQLNTDVLSKAPADVEDALRARVTQFYQYHVDGKFRQAEQLVAEDSKDIFYTSNKPRYFHFKIAGIQYSEHFTKALVTVVCNMIVPMPGFTNTPLDVPTPSRWKLENGQWCWYVDFQALRQTPFGTANPGAGIGTGTAAPGPVGLPEKLPTEQEMLKLLEQVKADKSQVRLPASAAGSDQVVFRNELTAAVKLVLKAPAVPGLKVSLDRAELKTGEKATLQFRYRPGKTRPAAPVTVVISVEPTNQVIPIEVSFVEKP